MRKLLLLTSLSMVLALMLAPAALADHHPAHVVIPGHHQAWPESGEPCPLGLDEMPPGTVCGEGGSYWVPNAATGTTTPTTTPTSTVTPTSTATNPAAAQYGGGKKGVLPETGGASGIALLAGALLVGGGVMSFALVRRS